MCIKSNFTELDELIIVWCKLSDITKDSSIDMIWKNPKNLQKDTVKLINDINKGLNKVVDNVAKSLKENTLTYGAAVAGAVKGGATGLANKSGTANLNFNKGAELRADKNAIISGVKGTTTGIVSGGTAQALFNIEEAFDKTKVGKEIDKAIDKGASAIKKGINFLFGGGSK